MGGGTYSVSDAFVRSLTYKSMSSGEIFTERAVNNAMSPNGVEIRESRDSAEHPESLAIMLALDVTGSMGSIPNFLVKKGLIDIMGGLLAKGVNHPQILFTGIGDHECDKAPLQVGQFESSDELLEHWLTKLWLEGGGGGNDGESYLLAWYFAAYHTSIDCWEKRKQKGFLFTIGDEPCLSSISKTGIKNIMGTPQASEYTAAELLEKAREKYHVFHFHMMQGSNGHRKDVQNGWKQLMGNNLILINTKEEVANIIVDIISSYTDKKVTNDVVKQEIIL